ncbi:MAG: lysophospholipid acyltransferase family protein [Chthonomonadales bacterium]
MEAEPNNRGSRSAERIAAVVYSLARFIGMTLHVDYEGIERVHDLVASGSGGILVTWHGRTLIPANVFRGMGFWALISLSRDGEIQNHIFRRFGYQTIRGSTGRGGAKAALILARKIREGGVLAFTPDGPRGPSHKVQPGTIFLAQRSQRPIIPLGISAAPRLLLKTWDRYMIPAPFARAAFVVGEPLFVPADADEDVIARATEDLERAIDACEARAEALVNR